jgi:hypothetical protein
MLTMFRRAWENFCRSKGQYEHLFAAQTAFHIGEAQAPLGKRIPWGQKDKRCSSMLRNSAGGRVCQYGVSATPAFWPYLHFKLKGRVLFAELSSGKAGAVIGDTATQHRLRRTICKGWRNKQWYGRLPTAHSRGHARRIRYPGDVTIVGRVTGVAMRIAEVREGPARTSPPS